jgi:predicted double-glycine peptidase
VIVWLHIIGQLSTSGLGLIVFIMLISSSGRMVNDPWQKVIRISKCLQFLNVQEKLGLSIEANFDVLPSKNKLSGITHRSSNK